VKTAVTDASKTPEPMPGRRATTGDERRQALVEAAFAVLTEKGFEGLRVRDVAARIAPGMGGFRL
jgi:AcrR family transcriptional regulator